MKIVSGAVLPCLFSDALLAWRYGATDLAASRRVAVSFFSSRITESMYSMADWPPIESKFNSTVPKTTTTKRYEVGLTCNTHCRTCIGPHSRRRDFESADRTLSVPGKQR